jgi:excisionase family DNA binding protein
MNTNEPTARASTVSPATADGLEPLLSIDTLAEYVGVPVVTIYRWRTEGKGPCAVRIGRHLRFALSDVRAWLETVHESQPGIAPHSR